MNTKLTKIRNENIDVCSVEQVVAYNICSSYADIYAKTPRVAWNWTLITSCIERTAMRCNKDMVQHFIMFNFESYIANGCKILSTYEEVGQMFKNGYKN
jgi:hypothetical protein